MTHRLTNALTAGIVLLAACAESSTAPMLEGFDASLAYGGRAYAPGEQQPVAEPATGSWAIYPEGEGQNLSQTFTPTENQWLGFLQLPVGCVAGVLLNVKIRDGLGGAVLYESNHSGLPLPVDGTFQVLQVFNPAESAHGIKLHKNHTYAFEVAAFPGPSAVGTTCGIAVGPSGDSYAGGAGFYRDPINGPNWQPLPDGTATPEDLPFITLVR